MTSAIPGIVTIVFITLGAGVIAYIGDRVGHQVGRRRLTLFGLRPKYTSTIVAVSTGMLIALSLTLAALAASQYVRQAVFRISALNDRINELQDQASKREEELGTTRRKSIVFPLGVPIGSQFLTLKSAQPIEEQRKALTEFFAQTTDYVNRTYTAPPASLKPTPKRAKDKAVQETFSSLIDIAHAYEQKSGTDAVVILPIVDRNLFIGDTVTFGFNAYADKLVARKGQVMSTIDVRGGESVQVYFGELIHKAAQTAIDRGMPPVFVATPFVDQGEVQNIVQEVLHARGRFHIVAKAAKDIYPHAPPLELDFAVVAAKR